MRQFRILRSLLLFTSLAPASPLIFTEWMQRPGTPFGEGARILLLRNGAVVSLTSGFHSAADPDVSWDGKRILFAAKQTAASHWQIYEMRVDRRVTRQVLKTPWDCRQPIYHSKIFYLDDIQPEPQITFVSRGDGTASHLYSARLDGTGLRQLTFGLLDEKDPFLNEDGRILYSSGHEDGRRSLFGVNLDGTDASLFVGEEGRLVKRMPARTTARMVVFVERNDDADWDGAGNLAAVDLRRNLHSYRDWTGRGLYAWPSPLLSGAVLVSRREREGRHAIYEFNPLIQKEVLIYKGAGHAVQAKELAARPMPDGRASVVEDNATTGNLYCLSVLESDQPEVSRRAAKIRVLDAASGENKGEVPLEKDGSFQLQLPANWAFRIEMAAADGTVLRRSAPIWVKNKENRGCIGCHEDRERTPENRFAEALGKPAVIVHKSVENGVSGGGR